MVLFANQGLGKYQSESQGHQGPTLILNPAKGWKDNRKTSQKLSNEKTERHVGTVDGAITSKLVCKPFGGGGDFRAMD